MPRSKCRFIFGGGILVLVTYCFLWYGLKTVSLVIPQNRASRYKPTESDDLLHGNRRATERRRRSRGSRDPVRMRARPWPALSHRLPLALASSASTPDAFPDLTQEGSIQGGETNATDLA